MGAGKGQVHRVKVAYKLKNPIGKRGKRPKFNIGDKVCINTSEYSFSGFIAEISRYDTYPNMYQYYVDKDDQTPCAELYDEEEITLIKSNLIRVSPKKDDRNRSYETVKFHFCSGRWGYAPATGPKVVIEKDIIDDAEAYINHVRKTPVLTHGEEYRLGLAASKGDATAQRKLVEHNQLWALHEARKNMGRGVDFEDLVQEANLGLMRAARDYDPDKGSFLGYASNWVQSFIRRSVEQKGSTTEYGSQIPGYLYFVMDKINSIKRKLEVADEKMDIQKLAEQTEESSAHVEAALEILRRDIVSIDQYNSSDLDQAIHSNNDENGGELLSDSQNVEVKVEDEDICRILYQGLADLSQEERSVLQKRYGLFSAEKDRQKDVCSELGITRGKLNWVQKCAIKKLQKHLENQNVDLDYA